MKLSEIKKCKVIELRAQLKELGLDPKGLKTELVGRLWSALEAGLQTTLRPNQSHQDDDTTSRQAEEVSTQNDIDVTATPSPPPVIATANATMTSSISRSVQKDTADTATQTDPTCSPVTTSSTRLEDGSPAVTPGLGGDPARREAADVGETTSGVRWADSSPPVPGSQEEEAREEEEEDDACTGDPPALEETRRNRAFYEFKEEIRYKRAKFTQPTDQPEGEVVEEDDQRVRIDTYASDLHVEVDPEGSCVRPRFWDRFPLLWAGCRLTHGVQCGGAGTSFEVRLEGRSHASAGASSEQAAEEQRLESHSLRVGWAVDCSRLPLGEDELSYAYDGQGRVVSGGKAEEFGEALSDGDIIGCYLLFSTDGAAEMSFHKNGRPMGVAFRPGPSELRGHALFPHVLCQGYSLSFRLDTAGGPWYPGPPGFTPLVALPVVDRVQAPAGPSSRTECEVIMMVGLPGSGKSHWARILMKRHPDKRYRLLGTETLLASMIGGGQWERKLQQASQCLTELIKMAALKPGNYILDQPNVFVSARRHKLQLFGGYRRRVVAVVFPPAEEWRRRLALRQAQDGERIPDIALLKLQVSYTLPDQQGEPFEELRYMELPQQEAQALLHTYREEARRLLPPVPKPQKKASVRKNRAFGPPPFHSSQWKRRYAGNDNRFTPQAWAPQPIYWNSSRPDQGYYYNTGVGYIGYQAHW